MTLNAPRIAVIGAGSWGTAPAAHLASQELATMLWAREPEVVAGPAIGGGRKLSEIAAEMNEVAEGVSTCRTAHELAARFGIEMPITYQIFLVLYEDKDPRDAMRDLLGRRLRRERASHDDTP